MKKLLQLFFAFTAIAFISIACASSQKTVAIDDMKGAWTIVSVNGKAIQNPENEAFIDFNTDENVITGSATCNNFRGVIVINENDRNKFQLENIASTRMACPDMETEQKIFEALNAARSTQNLSNGNLALLNESGETVLELKKQ